MRDRIRESNCSLDLHGCKNFAMPVEDLEHQKHYRITKSPITLQDQPTFLPITRRLHERCPAGEKDKPICQSQPSYIVIQTRNNPEKSKRTRSIQHCSSSRNAIIRNITELLPKRSDFYFGNKSHEGHM